ncbi:unnamed protein product [Leuciscus chuanchicus]
MHALFSPSTSPFTALIKQRPSISSQALMMYYSSSLCGQNFNSSPVADVFRGRAEHKQGLCPSEVEAGTDDFTEGCSPGWAVTFSPGVSALIRGLTAPGQILLDGVYFCWSAGL